VPVPAGRRKSRHRPDVARALPSAVAEAAPRGHDVRSQNPTDPMILTAIAAGLLFQVTPTPRDTIRIGEPAPVIPSLEEAAPVLPPPGTGDTIFDAPGTRDLVERVIRTGATVPEELRDYRAEMRAAIHLSMRADTAEAGEIPATVDELAGTVRWERGGAVEQTVHGHRVRLLAPVPYTVGSMLEAPWIIPHLYGNTINVFQLAAPSETAARVSRAIHPFSFRGIDFYRYAAGDTVRVRTQEGTTTLVPINVVPRPGLWPEGTDRLVAGAFWVDLDRAAVVRARFGFTERTGRVVVLETGIFFELESALVGGRFWLPYRQRREIQVSSPLLGGATALRMVTALSRFELNTGWQPERRVSRLVWALTPRENVFQDWERVVGEEAGALDIADFADLRELVRRPDVGGPIRAAIHYERSEHFFRHNRVEGPYLGLGVRVEPRDPAEREWSVYGTGGYAFAEGTPRGEVNLRWHPNVTTPASTARWAGVVGGYRRLREMTGFQPLVRWELGHTLGSAFAGYDVRDYYDVTGADAFAIRRSGPWTSRLGVRYERQDSVTRNTTRYALGRANDFPRWWRRSPGRTRAWRAPCATAAARGRWGSDGAWCSPRMARRGSATSASSAVRRCSPCGSRGATSRSWAAATSAVWRAPRRRSTCSASAARRGCAGTSATRSAGPLRRWGARARSCTCRPTAASRCSGPASSSSRRCGRRWWRAATPAGPPSPKRRGPRWSASAPRSRTACARRTAWGSASSTT
jgi:hypothetical protein